MKIALIGASGFVGSKVLAEALERGHQVTGIVRNPEKIQSHKNLTTKKADVLQVEELARILAGHDVVISSFNPARGVAGPEVFDKHVA
ncbi:MAG TPA: NAD(P)H-binding protein, partial [Candidatus Cybelea sp.]|nr:NAD(P)H-binding protein [Candidatus Cybelea sp.]